MEQAVEIREQLANYKEASTSDQVKADCFIADIALESFQDFIKKRQAYRESHLQMSRSHNSSSQPVLQQIQVPQFFVNNIPVRRLFLLDILYRVNKVALFECLSKQGCTDFDLISVKATKTGSVAVVECKTFASSCTIQIKACQKELTFTDSKGRKSIIRVRPDQFINQSTLQPIRFSKLVFNDLPNHLARFLNNSEPVFILCKYLSSNDFFDFYSACHEDSRLIHSEIPFDTSCDGYKCANALNILLSDASKFKFRSITFKQGCGRIEAPFVNKFLLACARRALNLVPKLKMKRIDVSGILLSARTIEILSESFETHKLVLSRTPGGCDEKLKMKNLVSLTLRDNDQLSLRFLKNDCFTHLVSLKIIGCNEVPIHKLCDFVSSNQSLKKLVFIDSQSKIGHTVQVSEAAMSGKNVLQIFRFGYSINKVFRVSLIPHITWNNSDQITEISLDNNDFFTEHISQILFKLSNL
ncbi:uncharacterized protein [Prorops nasuta]|uniref:uncharacterized protein n=1 Tax=Prorops nasuta TaxID=863751 RepID=UPI0034CF1C0C